MADHRIYQHGLIAVLDERNPLFSVYQGGFIAVMDSPVGFEESAADSFSGADETAERFVGNPMLLEVPHIGDVVQENEKTFRTFAEILTGTDYGQWSWQHNALDGGDFGDYSQWGWHHGLREIFSLIDIPEVTLDMNARDGLYVGDLCKLTWVKLIADALSLTELSKADWGKRVQDVLAASDSLAVLQKLTREILDGLSLQDHPAVVWEFLLADSLAATDSVNALVSILLAEALGLTDAAATARIGAMLAADGLDLTDDAGPDVGALLIEIAEAIGFEDSAFAARLYSLMIGDALSATDAALSGFLLSASLSDGFTLTADLSFAGGVSLRAEDTVTFTGTAGVMQALSILVQEGLDFTLSILDGNEYWEAWAVNSTDFHVSVYSNFDFNSYAEFNKEVFGAKDDGIYRIGGTTDAGAEIRAGLVLHETALSNAQMKRVRRAWLGVVETGGTRQPAIRMETEDGTSKTYTVKAGKADFSRQQKGRRWTVSVGDFTELDFIEIVPILMVR